MQVAYAAVLLLLLTAGCAHVKPETPVSEPPNVATQPGGTPQPAAKPAAQATPQPAPAAAPAPSARTPAPRAASRVTPRVGETPAAAIGGGPVRLQQPELFTYQELVTLGTTDNVSGKLGDKLRAITTTPFLSNEAYYRGARPHRPVLNQVGRSLRLVTWNIERGLELGGIELLFTKTEEFLRQAKRNEATVDIAQMRQDIEVLKSADIVVLNEVDWGLKRTGYRSVVRELGSVLNMNWAYGVEFIEVDPISLGTETLEGLENAAERQQLLAEIQVDKKKLRGLHGTAVLSRYPMLQARLEPFQTVGHDWYSGEKKALDPLEKGQRIGAEAAFLEKITRQIRRGGRNSLIVTLDVPDLNEKRLTVAATHLESNASA